MATSLNSVGSVPLVPRYPVGRDVVAAEKPRSDPARVDPALASVVRELNTVVTKLSHDLRVELDLGAGRLGARVINDSGVVRPIPLEYVAPLAALLRQSGVEPTIPGSHVDEVV